MWIIEYEAIEESEIIEVLTDNHYEKILDAFETTKEQIKIISPFLSLGMAKKLCDIVNNHNVKCTFITRFYLEDMFAKANSIDAIEMMMKSGIQVYALKGLHTKLYLFDENTGIVGSANFTSGGFTSNFELSLMAVEETALLSDLHTYYDDMLQKLNKSDEGKISTEVSLIANIIWLIVTGIPMAIGNAVWGCLLCITIIGIPFGKQFFNFAKLSLMPFGATIS